MISPRLCHSGGLALVLLVVAGCASSPSEEPVPVAAPVRPAAPAPQKSPPPATNATPAPLDANAAPAGPVLPARAASQFNQAVALLSAGKLEDAELELKTLIVAYPDLPAPHVNLGLLFLRANKFPDAELEFRAALKAAPQDVRALSGLALACRHTGKFREAEKAYSDALAVDPANLNALKNLGVLYDLYLQQPLQALPLYQKYQELSGGGDKQVGEWIKDVSRRAGVAPKPAPPPTNQPDPTPAPTPVDKPTEGT